jgi:hypothetical protein
MNDKPMDRPMDRTDPELLISRVVDGEATPEDWSSFRLQADREPSLWRDLAEAQRIQTSLGEEVGVAVAKAGYVDVPVHREIERRFSNRVRMVGIWGGWLAAACVGVMWAQNAPKSIVQGPGPTTADMNPMAALQTYLNKGEQDGRVLGELPEKVLVRATPLTGSNGSDIGNGYEVVYLRQILERAVVKDLYQYGVDEAGRQAPIRFDVRPAANGKPM